jgi:hypothetical protein
MQSIPLCTPNQRKCGIQYFFPPPPEETDFARAYMRVIAMADPITSAHFLGLASQRSRPCRVEHPAAVWRHTGALVVAANWWWVRRTRRGTSPRRLPGGDAHNKQYHPWLLTKFVGNTQPPAQVNTPQYTAPIEQCLESPKICLAQ